MPCYRKKPITVQAERFDTTVDPPRGVKESPSDPGTFYVTTIQGVKVEVHVGEWIIAEPDGLHFYPCADQVFQATYEAI